jgi:hypothetical protein
MKDIMGREITPGCYIAYGLIVGRSANLAVYQVHSVEGDSVKAHKLQESYGNYNVDIDGVKVPARYAKFEYDQEKGRGWYRHMTQAEKDKVDSKTTKLSHGKRALIIDGQTVQVLKAL